MVKYAIAGIVTLIGKQADVKKKLEVNPKTNIPQILFTVYQHVFKSIYMISSILNAPYPPPDLLYPMAEKIQILQDRPQESIVQETANPQPPAAGTVASATPVSAASTGPSA